MHRERGEKSHVRGHVSVWGIRKFKPDFPAVKRRSLFSVNLERIECTRCWGRADVVQERVRHPRLATTEWRALEWGFEFRLLEQLIKNNPNRELLMKTAWAAPNSIYLPAGWTSFNYFDWRKSNQIRAAGNENKNGRGFFLSFFFFFFFFN